MVESKKDKDEDVKNETSSVVPEVKTKAVQSESEVSKSPKKQDSLYAAYQPRQVSLLVNRVDPWTVMKMSFLLSVIFGLVILITVFLIWNVLNGIHVFSSIRELVGEVGSTSEINKLVEYLRLPRVMGLTMIFSIMNTVLITALSTIGAIIYNLCASLVGGIKVTLMDD